MIEHLVIALNPDSPECNITKKVPYFNLSDDFLGIIPKQSLFPIKTIIIVGSNPTKILCMMNAAHLQALLA